jgi:hypothetical protein
VDAVVTDRPMALARQFAGLEAAYIIPEERTAAGCMASLAQPLGNMSQVSLLLDICGAGYEK